MTPLRAGARPPACSRPPWPSARTRRSAFRISDASSNTFLVDRGRRGRARRGRAARCRRSATPAHSPSRAASRSPDAGVGGTLARMSTIAESPLSNKDLSPTGPEQRTWGTYNLAALWVGLSIVITTYTLASGLIAAGMEWWQGLLTVALG